MFICLFIFILLYVKSNIAAVGPAEKRQMTMVNDAFACLRKKASEGEVAPEIQQKVLQLAGDILQRNFVSASAIQAVSV